MNIPVEKLVPLPGILQFSSFRNEKSADPLEKHIDHPKHDHDQAPVVNYGCQDTAGEPRLASIQEGRHLIG